MLKDLRECTKCYFCAFYLAAAGAAECAKPISVSGLQSTQLDQVLLRLSFHLHLSLLRLHLRGLEFPVLLPIQMLENRFRFANYPASTLLCIGSSHHHRRFPGCGSSLLPSLLLTLTRPVAPAGSGRSTHQSYSFNLSTKVVFHYCNIA